MVYDDIPVLENCQNLEKSYGEICVRCNKCGRFSKEKDGETNAKGSADK